MNIKKCTKCKKELPATLEFFYKHAGGKFGITPRCKPCVNSDNAKSYAKRLLADPEKIRAQASARTKKSYHKNLTKSRERHRNHQAKVRSDPEKYAEIKSKKRAGGARLSVSQVQAIKDSQNNCCAICEAPNPTDLDHCHNSGAVRWMLCRHCNRGLGAFRDNPVWLRKAAQMLTELAETASYGSGKYQDQADAPVAPILSEVTV